MKSEPITPNKLDIANIVDAGSVINVVNNIPNALKVYSIKNGKAYAKTLLFWLYNVKQKKYGIATPALAKRSNTPSLNILIIRFIIFSPEIKCL
ncbi:hypothetical protein JP39_07665 [Companilactobacillus heilongjiangensis]|uniref:Uncharacterized protein n=1 Tax=Companilactobacillus heilongjiangensis TaxID=1074467 RepID=A0A0K2LDJ3_9LACO|nr:hypothetical protein JP39_07665 [Companilactobacillus heilongjiangensis]